MVSVGYPWLTHIHQRPVSEVLSSSPRPVIVVQIN